MPSETPRVVALFEDPERLLGAVTALRRRGFGVADVYTPYALHELDDALGVKRSRLGVVTMIAGSVGAASAIALQVWTSAVNWPLNVGGKPPLSGLAFLPITFELTVLFAGLGTAAAFLMRSRLFPGKTAHLPLPGVTDDRFALVAQGGYPEVLREILLKAGASEVREEAP